MGINKSLKNAKLTSGGLVPFATNFPTQYVDKQHQYYSEETKTFIQERAKYSSDYVKAQCQGLDPNDPFAWQERYIRFADVVRPSAAILRRADDYKMVLFADRDVEYVMMGAKIVTMGSTYLVTNPFNASGSDGAAIVQRCNAVWNYLDYYGNVISEPMVVTNPRADANDSDAQETNLITKGYFNVVMQYNDITRQIDTNTRFILGTAAYRVTGYSDFHQEFTGDYNSVRILEFSVRYEEPNTEIDDMENHVAGGKTFSWEIDVAGNTMVHPDQKLTLSAESIRNGKTVYNTAEYPVSYIWSSSDEKVAEVENGTVIVHGEGEVIITASLEQNPNHSATITLISTDKVGEEVRFTSAFPSELKAYEYCEISASLYIDGEDSEKTVEWSFSGADESCYSVVYGKKSVTVYCFGYSKAPLVVTASGGDEVATAEIKLLGL